MILASDPIVTQAAKWSHMFGGQVHAPITIRGIVNRGGEQGAQHSQALHSWFAHIPGLRVVMPATPADARDLLIASVLSNDPVLYIDDRWLYEVEADLEPIVEVDLRTQIPKVLRRGSDCTLVGSSYSTQLCLEAAGALAQQGIDCEVVDLRVLNPLDVTPIVESVAKTGVLVAVDGSWRTCGMAGEIIAAVAEQLAPSAFKLAPKRVTLPDAPAPSSRALEDIYFTKAQDIVAAVTAMLERA
jgi:pyruvate/2-oxoglutarate/acetoin dehydrogenase E1 component